MNEQSESTDASGAGEARAAGEAGEASAAGESGKAVDTSGTSESTKGSAPRPDGSAVADTRLPDAQRVSQYLQWALLGGLALFALVAAISLYLSVGRVIDVWIAPEFQPIFNAAFNLLVLLLSAAGISLLLRRVG